MGPDVDITIVRFALVLAGLAVVTSSLWVLHAPPAASPTVEAGLERPLPSPARAANRVAGSDEPDLSDATPIASVDGDADDQGRFHQCREVRVPGLKFPLLAIDDLRQREPGAVASRLLRRRVTAADHLMLALLPGEDEAALARAVEPCGGRVLSVDLAAHLALVASRVPGHQALMTLAGRLAARAPEEDALVHALDTVADDPAFQNGSLWGLTRIAADQAWDFTTGSAQVLVAVIDSGIDFHHPDLAANIWTNPGESGVDGQGRDKASNHADDDGNGYADDVHGVDFVAGGEPMDDNDHGTHVAGIIGACGGNRIGVAGVCWKVRMAALRILDAHGLGFASDAVRAVRYATAIHARVVNMAWSFSGHSRLLEQALRDGADHHQLFVAASGNTAGPLEVDWNYPAAYRLDNLITVAASDRDDLLATFSTSGMQISLAAPGVDVLSTVRGGYASRSGTSAAAAHVTGACALLAAFAPGLTGEQIRSRILATVDQSPALDHQCATGGRLNVYRALAPISVVIALGPPAAAAR